MFLIKKCLLMEKILFIVKKNYKKFSSKIFGKFPKSHFEPRYTLK